MADRDEDISAAELALGLLDGEERAAALRRVLAEPEFARQVEAWRESFGTLFGQWPDAAAPIGLQQRVIRSISPATPRNNFWPMAAAASMLLAVALGMILALRPAPAPNTVPAPTLVASLTGDSGAQVPVVFQRAAGQIRTPAMPIQLSGRSAELWMIAADGVPHSLGIMDPSKPAVIALTGEALRLMGPGIKLAVSSEPVGGSPSGLPTGPIIVSGAFISV